MQESLQDTGFKTRLISQILLADSAQPNIPSMESAIDQTVISATKPTGNLPEENLLTSAEQRAEASNTTFDIPVYFAYNSSNLTSSSKNMLRDLWQGPLSDSRIKHKLIIVGHTDSMGSSPYNMKLSRQRAMAVKNHLHGQARRAR